MNYPSDIHDLTGLILQLSEAKCEGEWWDFKKEWPPKEKLLYDIICLANNTEFKDAYLIIGVDEEHDYKFVNVIKNEHRKNTQQVTDFIKGQPFAGDLYPRVRVQELSIDPKTTIDILIVYASHNAPFFLRESKCDIHSGAILTRTMDTNTPKGKTASYYQAELLWRNHLGLSRTPLERLKSFLNDREGWQTSLEHSEGEKEFYKQFPEFTIEHIPREELSGYEYYLFEQTDPRPNWYEILVRYHQTVIWGVQGIALDGGRYFTSVPDQSFLHTPSHNGVTLNSLSYSYCYFVTGTLNHLMHEHLYRHGKGEERDAYYSFMRSIVLYDSEEEKEEIEQYIQSNPNLFESTLASITPYTYISDKQTKKARTMYMDSLKVVRYIQDELEHRRDCEYPFKLTVEKDRPDI